MAVASQSVDHCRRGNAGYVHGGARYQYRQRGAAAHRRQSFSGHRREYVGADVLSRFERHRAAAERLALVDRRTQAFLHELRCAVHDQFVLVRVRAQSPDADRLPNSSGCGRRRLAAERAGHSRRYFSSREARHGIRRLWRGGGHGSGHWSHARRLDHRQL